MSSARKIKCRKKRYRCNGPAEAEERHDRSKEEVSKYRQKLRAQRMEGRCTEGIQY